MIILLSFLRIQLLSLRQMCLFCMIQQQIRHTQFFRKLACFFYRTVMFLIRLELIRLTEQAECLMKQPVTAFHIFIIHLIIWLITDAGEFLTALKLHGESELFRLCRSNVEECHWTSENRSAVSVFQVVFGATTLELRAWMRSHGIARQTDDKTPEDHMGLMLVLMAWIARNQPQDLGEFLRLHLLTWSSHFLDQLIEAAGQPFYEGLARLTKASLEGIQAKLGLDVVYPRFYR